jgi:hypothetical protein
MISSAVGEITPDKIMAARRIRLDYMIEQQILALVEKGMTPRKAEEFLNSSKNRKKKLKLKDITKEDLCFRIKTCEHIPEEILADKKTLISKLLFQPFKHYAYVRGVWTEVGRSHWQGGLKTGKFSCEHGKMTDRLVRSLMLLCDHIGQRGNFRSYSYLADMKSQALLQLCQTALQFDEWRSSNPFAFWSTVIWHSFIKIIKQEKRCQVTRDELISQAGFSGSYSFQIDDEMKTKNNDFKSTAFFSEEIAAIPDPVFDGTKPKKKKRK